MSDTSSTNVSVVDPDFILYGHRGGGSPYPDETVPAYMAGIDWGTDYVEPDLYLTKDGVLVCSHDDEGFANETYAQALAANPSLMTLDQLIVLVQQESIATGRNIGLIPELKDQSEAAAQTLIDTLVAHDFTDPSRVVIQSFGTQNLQWLHDTIMPAAAVDFQLEQLGGGESIATIQGYAAYADIYAPSTGSFTAADVAAAHAAGLKVVAWTITGDQSEILPLIQMGVDGVFENATNDARPALASLQGAKVIYGTTSWDTISDASDTANTIIYGMEGDDIVRAGSGDNIVYGDAGNDVLFGGAGNDQLVGGGGTDFLSGGGGASVLDGSAGNDVIVASGSDDTVVFQPGDGIALVEVNASSTIEFSGINSTAITGLINDGGNLILRAGADALVIEGGADAANQPGTITFADGVTLTGSAIAAYFANAAVGTDAGVDAAFPGLNGHVVFQPGDGIELVSVDSNSTITFGGIASTGITGLVIDGTNLIIQIGSDQLVLADGVEADHQPGTIVFADGVTLTGSAIETYIAANAAAGTDAAVDAVLPGLEAKARPIVATGSEVLFRQGDGIDLVVADHGTTIAFEDITSTEVSVIQDGANLIIQVNDDNANNPNIQDVTDAVVIRNGSDAANLPAAITFADGVTWTGADLAAHAAAGTDAAVDAALPGLDYVLAQAPGLATASTVAVGTDLVANDGLGSGKLSDTVAHVEDGAVYRLSFTLADLGGAQDAGVTVLWNGQVVWQGIPDGAGDTLHVEVDGGSGDGSNQLVFEGAGVNPGVFDAALSDVSFVKLSDPGVPVLDNHAPVAQAASLDISEALTYAGAVTATDADGDPLAYTLGDNTAHGTLKFNADGTYTYTPDVGYTGTDSFSYIVNDGHGGASEASVSLTVEPGVLVGANLIVNGSFEDLSESTGNNGAGDWGYRNAGNPIVGWTEVNGGRIEQHWDTDNGIGAENGTIWIDMNGYQNNTDIVQQVAHVETGATYQLSFAIADADSTAGVTDSIEVLWGGQVVWSGVAPATGWETVNLRVVGGSGNGANDLEFVGTQANPSATTYGAALDNVQFIKLADSGAAVPDSPPVAAAGSVAGTEDQPVTGQLAATDPDGDAPLSYSLEDRATHGTVVVNANGTFIYTPDAGYVGRDAFTFLVNDGHGGTDVATETLAVAPPQGGTSNPNLIVNGTFEDHTGLTQTSTGWTNANGVLPGWTDASGGAVTVNTATLDTVAPSGTSDFDLDQNGGNAKIYQVVQGIETGATYTLTFSIAGLDSATATGKAATDSVNVYWGGTLIYSGTPENIWQTMTIDVVGGSGDGSNKLEFDGVEATPNGAGVGLDTVSLVKIDENPNLIVNGSFEDLTGAYDGNHPSAVPGNSPDWGYRDDDGKIAGWTQTNTSAGGRAELHFDTQNGAASENGHVWFDLDGNDNNAHLVQAVAGVETGQTYQLQFWIRDADGTDTDDGVKVYWGGKLVYTGLPTKTWEQITLQVVGGAGNGSNQLEFDGNETKLSGTGAALDNVSLRLIGNPNLIVNGSFEDLSQSVQNGTGGSSDWGYRNEGNPIAGWTEVNGGRIEQHWDTDNGVSAQDGDIWVDMNGYQNNTDIVQSVAGVEVGKTYQLSFSVADADSTAGVADGIEVLWGGQVVWNDLAPASGWETITLDVVGGAGDGLNKLEFVGTQSNPTATTYGAALDNVSLTLETQTPIAGTDGDDTLIGTASADLLIGGKGNDTLMGGAGGDTYLYSQGDGNDTIVERAGASGTDVLTFTDLNQGDMVFHQHGQDVEVELRDGSVITLQDQLGGDGAGIELVAFADGTAMNAMQIGADLTDRAPAITSGIQSAALSEWADGSADAAANAPHVASGAVTFTDADTGDTHTATAAPEGNGYVGTFTLDQGAIGTTDTVGWAFTVDEHSIDFLRAGQTLTQTYDVTIDDGLGGTATQAVTITITGVNDLPVATPDAAEIRAHQTGSFDLAANDTDAEDGKPSLAGFSVTSVSGIALSAQAAAAAFRIVDGKLAFQPSNLFNLAEGQQATLTFSYTAEDSEGGTATSQFTLTLDGDVITGPQYGGGTIQGSSTEDVINALGYNNTIYDNGGDDIVNAGQGQATVYAAGGDVTVALNGYNNLVQGYNASGTAAAAGADGNDSVSGSQGNTSVRLGDGQDTVLLGGYNNTAVLGDGNDTVNAGLGNGVVTLGDGDDRVTLSGYSNTIVAGNGQDTIVAGAGSDQVSVGSGNDTITLAGWSNQVTLGAGTDTVHGGSGDTITITGTALTLTGGTSETVFLGSGTSSLDDLSSGTVVKAGPASGGVSLSGFAQDARSVLELTGGVGGYKTAASVVSALQDDGHGGTLLMLGSGSGVPAIDFVNTAKDVLTAAHFRIG